MKKIYGILMLTVLAICSVTFVSCGDDDDEEDLPSGVSQSFIGTWRINLVEDEYQEWLEFQFKSDGTFIYRDWDNEENTIYTENGWYNVIANNLTLKWADGSEDTFVYSINGKKLMLVYIEGDNFDVGLALTMTKQ